MALESSKVREGTDGAALVLPGGRGDTRDAVLGRDLALVDLLLRELAGLLIPLERVRNDGRDVDVATEVARQVAEVGALLDDGTGAGVKA